MMSYFMGTGGSTKASGQEQQTAEWLVEAEGDVLWMCKEKQTLIQHYLGCMRVSQDAGLMTEHEQEN